MFFEKTKNVEQQSVEVAALINTVEGLSNNVHLETLNKLIKKAEQFDEALNYNMSKIENYEGDNPFLVRARQDRQEGKKAYTDIMDKLGDRNIDNPPNSSYRIL